MIGFLIWILIGGLAGWLASIVMKTNQSQGLLLDIVVGIVGSMIGGFVFSLLPLPNDGGFIYSLFVAFIGAVILLAILRAVRR